MDGPLNIAVTQACFRALKSADKTGKLAARYIESLKALGYDSSDVAEALASNDAPADSLTASPPRRTDIARDADAPYSSAPVPRSAEGRANLVSGSLPMGPVRAADGRIRIHACCPGLYREMVAGKAGGR